MVDPYIYLEATQRTRNFQHQMMFMIRFLTLISLVFLAQKVPIPRMVVVSFVSLVRSVISLI